MIETLFHWDKGLLKRDYWQGLAPSITGFNPWRERQSEAVFSIPAEGRERPSVSEYKPVFLILLWQCSGPPSRTLRNRIWRGEGGCSNSLLTLRALGMQKRFPFPLQRLYYFSSSLLGMDHHGKFVFHSLERPLHTHNVFFRDKVSSMLRIFYYSIVTSQYKRLEREVSQ